MAARSKARKRAVDVLYEAELREVADRRRAGRARGRRDPPVNDYTVRLVEGAAENAARIDEVLAEYSEGWTIERMPAARPGHPADRRLRAALVRGRAPAVVIDEAVELAKTLSTDESPRFVNGVLARVLRDVHDLRVAV